jgi:5-formyltetrahydrofolate cyclo-ligase
MTRPGHDENPVNEAADPALLAAKREARAQALERRAGADPELGAALADAVLRAIPPPEGAVIAGFWPIGDEIDIRPLLAALAARGHPIVLPETPRRGLPLIFRRWRPGAALIAGRFRTSHPDGPVLAPDVLFIPLLAFDRAGNRLGYGAGYYDRSLAGLPGARRIGCAYAAQEMDSVPAGPHDAVLDAVATEAGVIFCKKTE